MGLSAKTKILDIGGSKYILIPLSIKTDSKFPFNEDFMNLNEELIISIIGKKLVIEYLDNPKKEEINKDE